MIIESANQNKNFFLVLVSPNAGEIYNSQLRFISKEEGIPSPLTGRVFCLNYPWETVLNNGFLYRYCFTEFQQFVNSLIRQGNEKKGQLNIISSTGQCIINSINLGNPTLASMFINDLYSENNFINNDKLFSSIYDRFFLTFKLGYMYLVN